MPANPYNTGTHAMTFPAILRTFGAGSALGCGAFAATPAAATAGGQPELSISLRGISGGAVEVGEPFRVAVRLDVSDGGAPNVELAPASGSWIDATVVEIISTDGLLVPVVSRPAKATASSMAVALNADNPAHGLWWFPAESTSVAAPGNYQVRAKMEIRDGPGWRGAVESEPAPLRVVAASNDPDRVRERKLNHAHAAILAGEPAKAGEILRAMLEGDPDNVPALVLQGALSWQGGNLAAARACIDRALLVPRPPRDQPSAELNELAMSIERSKAGTAESGELAAWTRVPHSVFEPRRSGRETGFGISAPRRAEAGAAPTPAPIVATTISAPARSGNAPVHHAAPAPQPLPVSPARSEGPGVIVRSTELADVKVIADPAGQWAAGAVAGSQYSRTQYSASQATGAPNVPVAGNSPDAWCPAVRDKGLDWLELTFAKPIHAAELRVRQNDASGAIARVEAIATDGTAHVWWAGADPHVTPAVREITWFAVRVPRTPYLVARVKLTLNLASGPGYKQIDAVQLVAAPAP